MNRVTVGSALLIGALTIGAPTFATDISADNTVKVVEIDFKGKPPFKRTVSRLPVADVAALEAAADAEPRTRVVSTDFKGKPPFRRNVENLVVRDVASLEADDSERRTNFRGKPPFKR